MKKRLQGLIAGILIGTMLTSGMVFARQTTKTIQALYNDIKIYVDGVKINPKDANGNKVEPFIYNGTTYLPVRAIGEAINKQVSWDGKTQSVYIGEKPGDVKYLTDVCPAYQHDDKYKEYTSSDGNSFIMAGKKYTNGFVIDTYYDTVKSALFNLNGEFDTLTFTAGHIDGSGDYNVDVNIYTDGIVVETITLTPDMLPKSYSIDLNNALQLKIEFVAVGGMFLSPHGEYAFANVILK